MQSYRLHRNKESQHKDKSPISSNGHSDKYITNIKLSDRYDSSCGKTTVDKLIQQIDIIKKQHEIEKQQISQQLMQMVQNKIKQFQKQEGEITQRNQLLEQLLLQEQTKSIQLQRAIQEKSKFTVEKEKELMRQRIQCLEQQLVDNLKPQPNQNKNLKVTDGLHIQLFDFVDSVQRQIIMLSKSKRLNLSWPDYEVLDCNLAQQKEKSKFMTKLNKVTQHFFKCISDLSNVSLSPYSFNTSPKMSTMSDLDRTSSPLSHSKQQQFNCAKPLLRNKTSVKSSQTEYIAYQTEFTQTDAGTGLEKMQSHQQQIIVSSKKQQLQSQQSQTDAINMTEQNTTKTQLSYQNTIHININTKIPKQPKPIETKQIKILTKDNSMQTLKVQSVVPDKTYNNQFQQTQQVVLQTTISQTSEILKINQEIQCKFATYMDSEVQTQSTTTDLPSLDEKLETKLPKISVVQEVESDSGSGSSFDVNSPAYSTPQRQQKKDKMQIELDLKDLQIQAFEQKILETIHHYEQELRVKNARTTKYFDVSVTSTQGTMAQLLNDNWQIYYKDMESDQKYAIGFISMDKELLQLIMKTFYDEETELQIPSTDFSIKYYNKNFVDKYRVELMCKQINEFNQIIIGSKQKHEQLQYDQFWLQHIITHSNQIVYITKTISIEDLLYINQLEQCGKPILIYIFEESQELKQLVKFQVNTTYKTGIQHQIVQLSTNSDIIQMEVSQLVQGEINWELNESSFFEQIQQTIAVSVEGMSDFQLAMKEDDQFDLNVQAESIVQLGFEIPYLVEMIEAQQTITLKISGKQDIQNVLLSNNYCIIIMGQYFLIEKLNRNVKLRNFQGNTIYLDVV